MAFNLSVTALVCYIGLAHGATAPTIEKTSVGGLLLTVPEGGDVQVQKGNGNTESLGALPEDVRRVRKDVEEAKCDLTGAVSVLRSCPSTSANMVVATLFTCTAQADGCTTRAQSADEDSVKLFLRGAQGFEGTNIYKCVFDFTDSTIAAMDALCEGSCNPNRITSFSAGAANSTILTSTTTSVTCNLPEVNPAPAGDWAMTVAVYEGTTKLEGEAMPIPFRAAVPVISEIPDVLVPDLGSLVMPDEDTVVSPRAVTFAVTDHDSDLGEITAVAESSNPDVVAQNGLALTPGLHSPNGVWTLFVTAASVAPPCPSNELGCPGVNTTITVTVTDNHGGVSSQSFIFAIRFAISNQLAFRLDTGDDEVRHYADDTFWVSTSTVRADVEQDVYDGDIKTAAYSEVQLGEWVRFEYYEAARGEEVTKAWYQIKPEYREMTFKELVGGNYVNLIISETRAALEGPMPGQQDPFFDNNDAPLRVNSQNGVFNSGYTYQRIVTTNSPIYSNDHSFAGLGICHHQADWCADYEAQPNTGYCATSMTKYYTNKKSEVLQAGIMSLAGSSIVCSHHPETYIWGLDVCAESNKWISPVISVYVRSDAYAK